MKIYTKSTILTDLKHNTKCAILLRNIVTPCRLDYLNEQYFSVNKCKIITTFYKLIAVEKCDSPGLYDTVIQQLSKDNLKAEKLIGIGVDGLALWRECIAICPN